MKVRVHNDQFVLVSCIIMLIYANYNTLIDSVIGTKLRIFLLLGGLCIGLVPYVMTGIRRKHIHPVPLVLWGLFIGVIVLDNNYDIKEGTLFFTLRIIVALLLIAYISTEGDRLLDLNKMIIVIGAPNIIATFFFFIFRSQYRIMYRFYGFYPTGTDHGLAGYRAGLTNHYSQNATYLVYIFIALAAWMLAEKNKKVKGRLVLLTAVSFISLMLTSKRAHLLFSFVALLCVYFLISDGQSIVKMVKLLAAGGAGLGVFLLLGKFVQPIAELLERFATAGTDDESTTRFAMWELCIKQFLSKPIFGVGWAQFPQLYYKYLYVSWFDERYKYLNAHNVYLQVLCETGIVGFVIFMSIILYNLITTTKAYLAIKDLDLIYLQKYKIALMTSVAMQIFFIMYCMTGNGLYDYSFYFYMLSVVCGLAVRIKLEKMKLLLIGKSL